MCFTLKESSRLLLFYFWVRVVNCFHSVSLENKSQFHYLRNLKWFICSAVLSSGTKYPLPNREATFVDPPKKTMFFLPPLGFSLGAANQMAAVWRMKLGCQTAGSTYQQPWPFACSWKMSDTFPISDLPPVIVSNHAEKNGRIVFINPSLKLWQLFTCPVGVADVFQFSLRYFSKAVRIYVSTPYRVYAGYI